MNKNNISVALTRYYTEIQLYIGNTKDEQHKKFSASIYNSKIKGKNSVHSSDQ